MDAGSYRVYPAGADEVIKHEYPDENMARPGYSTTGRDVQVRVNQYKVTQWPTGDVYQYDVSSSPFPSASASTNVIQGPHWQWC